MLTLFLIVGAGEPEEDELYESGVVDSNGVYRLQGDKLVPHEDAWASIPSVSLLDSKEVMSLICLGSSDKWNRNSVHFILLQAFKSLKAYRKL